MLVSASENHGSSNDCVAVAVGCRLEVMRHLVQIIRDANVPVAWGHQNKKNKKTVPPDEEYLKSLTQRCTESLSTSAVLSTANFTKHPPS